LAHIPSWKELVITELARIGEGDLYDSMSAVQAGAMMPGRAIFRLEVLRARSISSITAYYSKVFDYVYFFEYSHFIGDYHDRKRLGEPSHPRTPASPNSA
jgi:hypothetical protein